MRHAIITAGSKGLGRQVAEYFINRGVSVTITYRNDQKKAKELLKQYPEKRGNIQVLKVDVTSTDDLTNLVKKSIERFGRVDYLVNNAGPYIFERKKLMDYSNEEWSTMIKGNLDAVFHLLKLTVPYMRKQKFGRIINYGFQGAGDGSGWIYRSAFSAAKVGLVSLTKTIAIEEAEHGITSNMICPGNITGVMKESTIQEARKKAESETPIGRPGSGEDIARTIGFLCEEKSDMITGTIYEVTGGLDVIHQYR